MKYPSLLRFLSKSWNFSDPVLLQRERIARMTVSFLNLCLISLMVQPSSASLRFSSLERLNLIFPRPVRCGRISHTRIYQGKLLILKLNHRNYFIYWVACPILNDTLQIIWSRNPYFSTLLLIIFHSLYWLADLHCSIDEGNFTNFTLFPIDTFLIVTLINVYCVNPACHSLYHIVT